MLYNFRKGEMYMNKPILALVFALMVTTCLALPRVHYKQFNVEEKEIPEPEKYIEETTETTTAAAETTTEAAVAEMPVVTTQAAVSGNTVNRSYSYEPVEIAPYASPSDTIVIKGISINIGDSISDITASLGQPVNTIYVPIEYPEEETAPSAPEPVTNAEGETETTTEKPMARADENAYGYDGFTIYTGDNKLVEKVEVTDSFVTTSKGIQPIGASVFSLADSYGGPVDVEGDIYKFAAGENAYMYFDAPLGIVKSWGIIKK